MYFWKTDLKNNIFFLQGLYIVIVPHYSIFILISMMIVNVQSVLVQQSVRQISHSHFINMTQNEALQASLCENSFYYSSMDLRHLLNIEGGFMK